MQDPDRFTRRSLLPPSLFTQHLHAGLTNHAACAAASRAAYGSSPLVVKKKKERYSYLSSLLLVLLTNRGTPQCDGNGLRFLKISIHISTVLVQFQVRSQ